MWTEPHAPSSLPAEKGHCHSAEEVASLNELLDLSGRSEAGLPRPGRSMTVASSRHLNLKLFGDFLCVFVGFAFCWWFCLIGSFAYFSLAFTFGSQLLPPAKQPVQFQANTSAGVDLGTGLTPPGPREGTLTRRPGAWRPDPPRWAERAHKKQTSPGLTVFSS